MEKLLNEVSLWAGLIGGFILWLLGGWDATLIALLVLAALDYLSGIIKSIFLKCLCSDIGYKGILKKVIMFIVVAAASAVQTVVGKDLPLQEMVIVFFIANEALSILENASQAGIPIPERFKAILLKMRSQSEKEDSDGEKRN